MSLAYSHPFVENWWVPTDGEWGNNASWRSYPPHAGVDYNIEGGSAGKNVRAIADGTIRGKGWHSNYGNRVYIEHDDGMWSHYAHMQTPALLNDGVRVSRGTIIGNVGNTGLSYGAHLHLEMATSAGACHNGNTSIDPITFINNHPGSNAPDLPTEDGMTHSISVNGNQYAVGAQFISHYGTAAQAEVTRQVTSATDELHPLSTAQFGNLLDGLGIPRNVLDATGKVLDPATGAYAANAVWSREREILAALV